MFKHIIVGDLHGDYENCRRLLDENKILDDANHLLVGFEHDGRADGAWKFLNWDLVDASGLQVRLKAEFQGSNKDIYRPEMIVGSSRK